MYKVGQRIVFVDEPGEGKILEVMPNNLFLIEDEHGFSRVYLKSKITPIRVPVTVLNAINHVPIEKAGIAAKKTPQKHNGSPIIIDLHIHELVEMHENWTNSQIVNYQMDFLKKQIDVLMKRRVKIVHIIHGVGEGVLRNEVRQFLRKFANCEINDLSYTRNGFGATEFVIRYKGNV